VWWSGQPVPHQAVERVGEPASFADSGAEAERSAEVAGADLGRDLCRHSSGSRRSSSVALGPTTADQHCST
jgi:hypothetical protein